MHDTSKIDDRLGLNPSIRGRDHGNAARLIRQRGRLTQDGGDITALRIPNARSRGAAVPVLLIAGSRSSILCLGRAGIIPVKRDLERFPPGIDAGGAVGVTAQSAGGGRRDLIGEFVVAGLGHLDAGAVMQARPAPPSASSYHGSVPPIRLAAAGVPVQSCTARPGTGTNSSLAKPLRLPSVAWMSASRWIRRRRPAPGMPSISTGGR